MVKTDVIIIGGGASGYFTANQILEHSNLEVIILEKTNKILSKVKVSGGGRCNVTNQEQNPRLLSKAYPRGEKILHQSYKTFGSKETWEWFNGKGANLKIEKDGRVFPTSNNSDTIISILTKIHKNEKFQLLTSITPSNILREEETWKIKTKENQFSCTYLVFASGSVNKSSFNFFSDLGFDMIPPLPSLFTFNLDLSQDQLTHLQGVAHDCTLKIAGEKLESDGPLLFTHWGLSGPAALKISAFGARILAQKNYNFKLLINFSRLKYNQAEELLQEVKNQNLKKLVKNTPVFNLPNRLWLFLLERANLSDKDTWNDINGKKWNKIINELTQAEFQVTGKSTFKEEFVTAGGLNLQQVNKRTFEHLNHKNLYVVGELLNIDAITGGYNFQSCWTTGYLAAKSITQN